ncbi:AP endonuclease [Ceratobasidium sp. AG-Ba]|nr:AP endonuclease [Ceratobasidium sp. AG-Ba]
MLARANKAAPKVAQAATLIRSFSSPSLVARAKAAKPPAKKPTHKSAGFKVKKDEYVSSRRTTSSNKPTVLPASQLAEHHLFQNPPQDLGLPELSPAIFTGHAVGSAITLPSKPGSIISAYGLPLSIENEFALLASPASVIRESTLSILDVLDAGFKSGTSNKDARVVLTGNRGSGKSHLLLQAANYAAASKWVVLYVPKAIKWVDSTTPYAYDTRTRTFQQPELALQTLAQFVEANSAILRDASVQISTDIQNERLGKFSAGTPLSKLLDLGLKDQSLATEVLEVTLEQLGRQNKYPVLIAVDDFQALLCVSKYRDPQYELLFAHHLTLPRLVLEYACGKRTLAKGAVLGANSSTHTRFQEPLVLKEALGIIPLGSASPYERRNENIVAYASGLKGFSVPSRMQIGEAASMFDIWAQNKALHTPSSDSLFLSKYVEASGNPGDMVKTGFLATFGFGLITVPATPTKPLRHSMRILTWNINGIRSLPEYHPWYTLKTCSEILRELKADILCFQEMKISRQLLTKQLAVPDGYDAVMSFPKNKGGYSGVAVYTDSTKTVPLKAEEGLTGGPQTTSRVKLDEHERVSSVYPCADRLEFMPDGLGNVPSDLSSLDNEGRTLVVDFGLFVLINVYCPNEGSEERLPFKFNFHKLLEERVRILISEGREVIVLGDMNVVAAPVDHCDGSLESQRNVFWERPVRVWYRQWLHPEGPMVDAVRNSWPNREKMFTCWNTLTNARESNYGTRIDYILLTEGLLPWFKHGDIQPDIRGSDHCPVFIDLHDEITSPDGQVFRLADRLSQPFDPSGSQRSPPPISTGFWDEYSGKQKLLSNFFGKKSTTDTTVGRISLTNDVIQQTNCSTRPDPKISLAESCVTLDTPSAEPKEPSQQSNSTTEPSSQRHTSTQERKRKAANSSTQPTDSNSKKLKKTASTSGQPKLAAFFPASKSSKGRSSSPPIELSGGSEDEPDLELIRQDSSVLNTVELASALPSFQIPDNTTSKAAWSQLMKPLEPPRCTVHNALTKEYTVNKAGPNKGKKFFLCSMPMGPGYDSGKSTRLREEVDPRFRCNYFKWASEVKKESNKKKVVLQSSS